MISLDPGFHPFWFWNAEMEEIEIRWQIQEMAAQGIKGFFIHSRQGLTTPYLSRTFFRIVRVAVDEAKRHGMVANLYDEYPYPSGVAGGAIVVGNPAYQATSLSQVTYDQAGGQTRVELPRGKVLFCKAYGMDGDRVDWTREIDCAADVGIVLSEDSYL